MHLSEYSAWLLAAINLVIVLGLCVRVVMKRHPPGTSLAWILLALLLPYLGAALYILIGERPLGRHRARHAAALLPLLQLWVHKLPPHCIVSTADDLPWDALRRTAATATGLPAMRGNHLSLECDSAAILRALVADIAAARHTVLMEFYIWQSGGIADAVAQALCEAAARGVNCKLLLDAAGSRSFLRSAAAQGLRDAGVAVVGALPVGLLRAAFVRFDLRLHRKLVVIDGELAWTGSLNLVDPQLFKTEAGVGAWVDAMCRIEGSAVEALSGVFLWDWCVETGQSLEQAAPRLLDRHTPPPVSSGQVQVLPSGPGFEGEGAHRLLLAALYAAQHEIVLTTPYFVPDEALMIALESAAGRGVEVAIVVPLKVDSLLVRFASASYFDRLLSAGVRIHRFYGGLLHTKSVCLDGAVALFGTTNLDIRSFRLNFELTLVVYDATFTSQLRALQARYIEEADTLETQSFAARSLRRRLAENAARLASPLL